MDRGDQSQGERDTGLSKHYNKLQYDLLEEQKDHKRSKDCIALMEKEITEQKYEIDAL